MVGEIVARQYSIEKVLSEKEIVHIIKKCLGADVEWELVGCEVKAAIDGLAGFLGDHMRVTLRVRIGGDLRKISLFVKHLPMENKPKAEFIDKFNYFRREVFMYRLFEELRPDDNDTYPWRSRAYIYNDTKIVMPDLAVEGYAPIHFYETLDLPHILITINSLAKFHSVFTNYETKKIIDTEGYSTFQRNKDLLTDPTFCDSPWLRAGAKLTVDLLDAFSSKFNYKIENLQSKLVKLYIEACDSLTETPDTVNVLLHKDLWVNNVMFKYQNNEPVNAMLVDFQCLRYGPPTFDLMVFLYLSTNRSFREKHEREIFLHYYKLFMENLDADSKQRLEKLGYSEKQFLSWCERSRMFAAFEALGIFPWILMDPKTAQKAFDDPDTYDKIINEDRSELVISYAREHSIYKKRQLEVSEEFVERYVLNGM